MGELIGPGSEGFHEALEHFGEFLVGIDKGDLEGGRVEVIGRLRQIDMVVRMAIAVLPAFVSQYFQRTVGNDFVGIHISRGSGSSLNHVDHKLRMPFAVDVIP